MTTITFDLPDDLAEALGESAEAVVSEVRVAAALHWCGRGEMSTSKAARLAGLTYAEFLDEAARQKVDLYDYDSQEIGRELARPLAEGVNLEAIKEDLARARSHRG